MQSITETLRAPATAGERHHAAVANSLSRAEAAADAGRFDDALAWLEVVRAVNGSLSDTWAKRRRTWEIASRDEGYC